MGCATNSVASQVELSSFGTLRLLNVSVFYQVSSFAVDHRSAFYRLLVSIRWRPKSIDELICPIRNGFANTATDKITC